MHMVCHCRLKKFFMAGQASRCYIGPILFQLLAITLHQGQVQLNFLVYVDDLIVLKNDSSIVASFKKYFGECFHRKDLSILKYFLVLKLFEMQKVFFFVNESTILTSLDQKWDFKELNMQSFQSSIIIGQHYLLAIYCQILNNIDTNRTSPILVLHTT